MKVDRTIFNCGFVSAIQYKKIRFILFSIVITLILNGCADHPPIDKIPIKDSEPYVMPGKISELGLTLPIQLDMVNTEFRKMIGTTFEGRVGVSVKVRIDDVVINLAKNAAIHAEYEARKRAEDVRHAVAIQACNRHLRSKNRRNCRNSENERHHRNKQDNINRKNADLAKNRKKQKIFEFVPSSGQSNYLHGTAELTNIHLSAKGNALSIQAAFKCKLRVNIENPIDHAREIKGLAKSDFNIAISVTTKIGFAQNGSLVARDRKIDFNPKFELPSILKPIRKIEDKINGQILTAINKLIDKQVARIDVKKYVNGRLVEFTNNLNEKLSQDNVWIIPDFKRVSLRLDNDRNADSAILYANLGVQFMPRVVLSKNKPDELKGINYDIILDSDQTKNNLSITTSLLANLKEFQPRIERVIETEINEWLKENNDWWSYLKKRFDVSSVELYTAKNNIMLVVNLSHPFKGRIILSSQPILAQTGQSITFSDIKLSLDTKNALTKVGSWILHVPIHKILDGKLKYDFKEYVDKTLYPIVLNGFQINNVGFLKIVNPVFYLKYMAVEDWFLTTELVLDGKTVITN